ncbi:MAG TPA: DMT family transporter [Acidimicrobiales bacterium]|nr:DMT family transporter [Acidimicrobiales bacterium]
MTAILALSAAAIYGTADFLGGVAARRTSALAVTVLDHVVGLVLLVGALALLPAAHPTPADLAYGAGAGALGGVGLILFYRAMAEGAMSVVAPVAALFGAALPVTVGVALGEHLSVPAFVGIAVAVAAVALVSREEPAPAGMPARRPRPSEHPMVLAVLAGLAFGGFFVLLSRTHASAGLWPLLGARVASIALLGGFSLLTARSLQPTPGSRRLIVAAGVGDMLANVLYLLAVRRGLVSLVAVIVALYPATTVLLAQVVLGERLRRVQVAGLALAASAAVLLALA